MKKSLKFLLSLLVFLGISLTLYAQSNEEELDQVELTKQFIGKWVTDWDEETVLTWEVIPVGRGYEVSLTWTNEDQLIRTDKGVYGFTPDGMIAMHYMWAHTGNVTCDYGKFISKNEISMKRYNTINGNVVSIFDFDFISPKKMKMVWKSWGPEGSPEDAEVIEKTWTKMN